MTKSGREASASSFFPFRNSSAFTPSSTTNSSTGAETSFNASRIRFTSPALSSTSNAFTATSGGILRRRGETSTRH